MNTKTYFTIISKLQTLFSDEITYTHIFYKNHDAHIFEILRANLRKYKLDKENNLTEL